ncbi:catalase-related domain-containing protein, partial [Bacillus cereus]|nr:catalase-related domain-containing protein [Bacillus cereus]
RDSTMKGEGYVSREKIEKPNDLKQAGERYRSFSKEEQDNLIANLTNDLKDVNERTKLLAVCNFFRADQEYGMRLAQALNVDITQYVGNAPK